MGNHVIISGRIALTSKGASVGAARIYGLPFTVTQDTAAAVQFNKITYANMFISFVFSTNTYVRLAEVTEAGVFSDLTEADLVDDSVFRCGATYKM